jgi:2-polyprenyl-3-methyl-5-hydroxy-6-metoxy-1,4-benzoquinol methylase
LGEKWDVVICFDVLYHLLSPLQGIRNLYDLTGECLVIGTTIVPDGESSSPNWPIEPHVVKGPVLRFEPGYNGDQTNYLYPTERCLVRMLEWAGFHTLERKYYYKESANGYFHDRTCYHCWVLPANFNPDKYLELNPDVAEAGVDPIAHWKEYGHREGRQWK